MIEHPNADRLEVAKVGGYLSVIAKGILKTGDIAAYIPEGSMLPDWLIEQMDLVGRLSGKAKNRVKAAKLRGILSQGLVLGTDNGQIKGCDVKEGDDVTELLEVIKYEPPIPDHMLGSLRSGISGLSGLSYCIDYDIEDIKRYPEILQVGELVVLSEKLHGTWCCLGIHPDVGPVVSSKGLSSKGLMFDVDEPKNEKNLYVRVWHKHKKTIEQIYQKLAGPGEGCYVIGELIGCGVQDLHYGLKSPSFRVFDIKLGDRTSGRWLSPHEVRKAINGQLEGIPWLFEGAYDEDLLKKWTEGESKMPGAGHIREGVVIRLITERMDMELGRVILKSISGQYLTRKGGTEYN